MQVIYLLVGIISFIMMFYGAKWLLRYKTVFSFLVSTGGKQFAIKKRGTYSICIKKSHFGKAFKYNFLITKGSGQNKLESKENFLKWSFRKKGKMFVEHTLFKVSEIGNYTIKAELLKPNQDQNDLIIIKETVSITKKILGILFLVFGVNGSFWGIMLFINPTVFAQ
jgi:hypothetical protein